MPVGAFWSMDQIKCPDKREDFFGQCSYNTTSGGVLQTVDTYHKNVGTSDEACGNYRYGGKPNECFRITCRYNRADPLAR